MRHYTSKGITQSEPEEDVIYRTPTNRTCLFAPSPSTVARFSRRTFSFVYLDSGGETFTLTQENLHILTPLKQKGTKPCASNKSNA